MLAIANKAKKQNEITLQERSENHTQKSKRGSKKVFRYKNNLDFKIHY